MMGPKHGRVFTALKIVSIAAAALPIAYLLLLYFPQPLFAYSTKYENFQVYSREPIRPELTAVLYSAETRLRRSAIYDASATRHIYLTDSFGMYALLSHKAYYSFANSIPYIENVIINRSDVVADRVFMDREKNNSRSLSGVLAHEVTHLLINHRYGATSSMLIPTWKKEGYCEYIAGDTTIPIEEGIRLWRANPSDDTGYRFIRYQLMVQYLLEQEQMSVDELFTKELDEKEIAAKTFAALDE